MCRPRTASCTVQHQLSNLLGNVGNFTRQSSTGSLASVTQNPGNRPHQIPTYIGQCPPYHQAILPRKRPNGLSHPQFDVRKHVQPVSGAFNYRRTLPRGLTGRNLGKMGLENTRVGATESNTESGEGVIKLVRWPVTVAPSLVQQSQLHLHCLNQQEDLLIRSNSDLRL